MELALAPNGYMCPDDTKQRWSVNEIEARIVSELCRGLDVLEIGTGLGVSTKAIASQARHVYTVDVDRWVKDNVVPALPENVTFLDDVRDVPNVDAAFIDGSHTYQQCKKDIRSSRKVVKTGGIYIFHDVKIEAVALAIRQSNFKAAVWIETYAGLALAYYE